MSKKPLRAKGLSRIDTALLVVFSETSDGVMRKQLFDRLSAHGRAAALRITVTK
jgi:hypothetical protein